MAAAVGQRLRNGLAKLVKGAKPRTDLGSMWDEAVAIVGGAIAGWFIAEFAGGVEGWRQRRILRYLEIARELEDTPEGVEARRLAVVETGRLVASKGTSWRLWAWGFVAASMILLGSLTIAVMIFDLSSEGIDFAPQTVTGLWVLLGEVAFLGLAAVTRVRSVWAVRKAQVPKASSRIVTAR